MLRIRLINMMALALASVAQTHAFEYKPAGIGTNADCILQRLTYPAVALEKRQKATVQFFFCIDKVGTPSAFYLKAVSTNGDVFVRAVKEGLSRARFEPASFEGKAVDVRLGATVVFTFVDTEPIIEFLLDDDMTAIRKGKVVTGPQIVLNRANTPAFPKKALDHRVSGVVLLQADAGTDCQITNIRVVAENPKGFGLAEAATKSLQKTLVIPGMVDGLVKKWPLEAPYVFECRQ